MQYDNERRTGAAIPLVAILALFLVCSSVAAGKEQVVGEDSVRPSETRPSSSRKGGIESTEEKTGHAKPDLPTTCPKLSDDVDEEHCRTVRPADYGLVPEAPLEIGLAASGRSIWFGRLLCPNGALPEVTRRGNIGPPKRPSRSPLSAMGRLGFELLDVWEVRCPLDDTPTTLYTNIYRCGLKCPPGNFRVLDARRHGIYLEAAGMVGKGRFSEALKKMEEIGPEERTTEKINHRLGVLYLREGRLKDARAALEIARAMDPVDPYLRLHVGFVDLQEGNLDAYAAVVTALLEELPEDHALHPELACRKGVVLRESDEKRGKALMGEACEQGHQPCCTMLEE